jgi:hypothetical protein
MMRIASKERIEGGELKMAPEVFSLFSIFYFPLSLFLPNV